MKEKTPRKKKPSFHFFVIASDREREKKAVLYYYRPREPNFRESGGTIVVIGLLAPHVQDMQGASTRGGPFGPSGSRSFVVIIISSSLTIVIGGGLGSANLPSHMHVQRGP
jgi:hypothetical protein